MNRLLFYLILCLNSPIEIVTQHSSEQCAELHFSKTALMELMSQSK